MAQIVSKGEYNPLVIPNDYIDAKWCKYAVDRNGEMIIFIVGMIGILAILFVAPVLEDIFNIGFAEELIFFITIFVGGSLYQKRKKKMNLNMLGFQ